MSLASGLSTLNKYQIAERGARMTRRVDREYREYLREAQCSQPGWRAREVVLDQRGQPTRSQADCRSFRSLSLRQCDRSLLAADAAGVALREMQEAERKRVEAVGIEDFQDIITQEISEKLLE